MAGEAEPPEPHAEVLTRVSVASTAGIPEGSVLCVRAGGFRRQRPLSRCSEPFVFRGAPASARPLQVDVLVPVASSGDLGDRGEGQHEVTFRPLGSSAGPAAEAMAMTLQISQVLAEATATAATAVAAERPGTASKVQKYMDNHALKDHLTHALMTLLREQPEDPMGFLSTALGGGVLAAAGRGPPAGASRPGGEAPAPRRSLPPQPQQPTQVRESMHVLPPCVALGLPTRLLDFGSGETGFNTYSMDKHGGQFRFKGNKRKAPFFAAFVEPNLVSAFADALCEEFALEAAAEPQIRIFAGATGLHRELLDSFGNAVRAQTFLAAAEKLLAEKLGKPVRIWLFVPSGLLEAQFELFATEWLVGRSSLLDLSSPEADPSLTESLIQEAFSQLDHNGNGTLNKDDLVELMASTKTIAEAAPGSTKDLAKQSAMSDLVERGGQVDYEQFHASLKRSASLQLAVQTIIFSGTLSAGGGSSQLAMMGPSDSSALQLFSVPVGNRVPIVEGLFSKPVLDSERQNWGLRVRSELRQASFPCGVRGLFVGISAAYHAISAAGAADRVISLGTALRALEQALQAASPEDPRDIANMTLIYELMKWCFDDSACFVFKRQWKTPDGEFVSTWTLGLFTQQHATKMAQELKTRPRRKEDLWKAAASRVAAPFAVPTSRDLLDDNRGQKMESLFEVPFVAWPLARTHVLDLGSGEVGLYAYEADLPSKMVLAAKDKKIAESFFDGFVKENRTEAFAELLIEEFQLVPDRCKRREIIAGGATGLHREMLLSDKGKRDQIFAFVAEVEAIIAERLRRRTCIRLFVPSGELEAQFELRAVQWLISVPGMDIESGRLPEWMVNEAWCTLAAAADRNACPQLSIDMAVAQEKLSSLGVGEEEVKAALHRVDSDEDNMLNYREFTAAAEEEPTFQALVRKCAFRGTISAGGGSSQLTLTSCRSSLSQLFSAPVGNRVPTVQRLFSEEVTWVQRSDWIARIHAGLRSSQFPRGLTGFFVGISAMYHAAKASGVADRLVTRAEATDALAGKLATLETTDHRSIANLTLVKEIITWVFAERNVVLLFKRNWSTDAAKYVAGWTLGLYCTQFMGDEDIRERSVVFIQKIERGRQARRRALMRPKTSAL